MPAASPATTGPAGRATERHGAGAGLRWLEDHSWPLWLEHGIDWKRRAFHEHLDLVSLQCTAPFRRLRVAARQTYAFAKAAPRGIARAREAVALGLEFLEGSARLADGGFASRCDLDNRPLDGSRDLYDHAFVLLAYAAAAPVVGCEAVRGRARSLHDHLLRHFRHPAGGFHESLPPSLPRRQNPHMHLFEAALAAHAAFGEETYLATAREIATLFLRRFFDARGGTLAEFFDDALTPLRQSDRFLVEPGHHYEWAWLIDCYAEAMAAGGIAVAPELSAACERLLGFAERHGIMRGLVVNALWSDGGVQDGGFRLWPQTERLKAAARHRKGVQTSLDDMEHVRAALDRHFEGVRAGLWVERFDAAGRAGKEPAPATSLYHLTAALTDAAVLAQAGTRDAIVIAAGKV